MNYYFMVSRTGWTDGRTEKRTVGWTEGRTDERTHPTNGRMNGQVDGWTEAERNDGVTDK